ncbi:hypothetical protein B0O80DRAFT_421119 [Mortierella sp. GBAus27b]|nr:hypothetical protein B0O80DRAFT_421119 [Mortierella sp. GBAus27b]
MSVNAGTGGMMDFCPWRCGWCSSDTDSPSAALHQLHHRYVDLEKLFGLADIKIHLDGKQAAEKQKARSEREAVRAKKLVSLNEALTTMERNSDKGVWTSRNVMRRIDNGLRGIFQLTAQEKEDLVGGLTLGFDVCQCTTEADVCIGFSAPGSITISGDSDLLAYKNITTVIRPIPKQRRKFAVYEKS